jgi:hypothetical protein
MKPGIQREKRHQLGHKDNPQNDLERREIKISNFEVTPYAIWPLAKSIMKTVRPKAPTAIHGPSGPKFPTLQKPNMIATRTIKDFV